MEIQLRDENSNPAFRYLTVGGWWIGLNRLERFDWDGV